jgi:hypothetical protein
MRKRRENRRISGRKGKKGTGEKEAVARIKDGRCPGRGKGGF